MVDTAYLDNFEEILEAGLIKVCKGAGLLGDELLGCPDIDDKWDEAYIKDYIADAVENINEYPEAALAWAGFLGIGVACNWDAGWDAHSGDAYRDYYGSRGWDNMDEHILCDLLGLSPDGQEAKTISDTMDSCALATLGLIRHEAIETQTETGFYILSRSYSVIYRLGAAIELRRLGYKRVALNVGTGSAS